MTSSSLHKNSRFAIPTHCSAVKAADGTEPTEDSGDEKRFACFLVKSFLYDMGVAGLMTAWGTAKQKQKNICARWMQRRAAPVYMPSHLTGPGHSGIV